MKSILRFSTALICLLLLLGGAGTTLQADSAIPTVDPSSPVVEDGPHIVADESPKAAVAPRYPKPVSQSQSISSSGNLLNLMLGLILIVMLIFALGWLARRMGQGGLLGNKHIKVVAAMPLGTRERIMVIEVGGQQLLLGVTATQITTLHTFTEPVIVPESPEAQSDFGKKLLALMQQKSPATKQNLPESGI